MREQIQRQGIAWMMAVFFSLTAAVAAGDRSPLAARNPSAPARPAGPPEPATAPDLPPVKKGLIERGPSSRPWVAITFDACEDQKPAGFDQKIWNILMDQRAKATIFLGGKWMESHPAETRMIGKSDLIEIGNHSYIHPDFRKLTPEQMRQELKKTQNIQWKLMGKQGVLFRFPFGFYDERALAVVGEMGLYPIQWDVVSGDADRHVEAGPMAREVLAKARPGSIIIFHINGRGWHTAEALPNIIAGLRKKGFQLVTVSELLGLQPVK